MERSSSIWHIAFGFERCVHENYNFVLSHWCDIGLNKNLQLEVGYTCYYECHLRIFILSFDCTADKVKCYVFRGRRTIFFSYVASICMALIIFSLPMLPKAIDMTNLPSQIAFGGSILFMKCFIVFQAQSSGKLLIFNTVSFDNANFVDGFRSFVGNILRLYSVLFLFVSWVFCTVNVLIWLGHYPAFVNQKRDPFGH